MPLRSFPFFVVRRERLFFHSTAIKWNHYETLQLPIGASPTDIKKQFYALSKTHHPDRNPNDPSASQRFVKISEAYATLSTPFKRQEYDRSINVSAAPSQQAHPQGSYYSGGPAGGRPASGLSRRRTQFTGPPPSFYRSGGWGSHSAKRQAAQENGTSEAEKPAGGMGYGQAPGGSTNQVPHFDRAGHTRTHESIQGLMARRRRMSQNDVPENSKPGSLLYNFLIISMILVATLSVPAWLGGLINPEDRKERKARNASY